MNKFDLLSKAIEIVESRGTDYGNVLDNHIRIASIWSVILEHPVKPEQVALCMAGTKIARLIQTPTHLDSWLDLAGYASVGSECVQASVERASTQGIERPVQRQQSNEQSQQGESHADQ